MGERELMEGLANAFETYGSDQLGALRWQGTQKAKEACRIKAGVWADAANEIRTALSAASGRAPTNKEE